MSDDGLDAIAIVEAHPAARSAPQIARVERYWRSLNDGNPPAKASFDFMSLYKLAPNMLMAERMGGDGAAPAAFRFIYCGTFVAENFPLDLTGKTFGPTTPRTSQVPWPLFFGESLARPCLRFGREPIDWPNREYYAIDYGVFPLTGADRKPRYALACLIFIQKFVSAER